jgi:hypothetical protein
MTDLRPYLRAVTGASKLTIGDRLVLHVLATFANDDGYAWPSSSTMRKACGMRANNVRRCLARLVTAGVIDVAERRKGRSTVYRFPQHPSTTCAPTGSGADQPEPRQAHPPEPVQAPTCAPTGSDLSPGGLTEVPRSTKEEERARAETVDNYGDAATAKRMRMILEAARDAS